MVENSPEDLLGKSECEGESGFLSRETVQGKV